MIDTLSHQTCLTADCSIPSYCPRLIEVLGLLGIYMNYHLKQLWYTARFSRVVWVFFVSPHISLLHTAAQCSTVGVHRGLADPYRPQRPQQRWPRSTSEPSLPCRAAARVGWGGSNSSKTGQASPLDQCSCCTEGPKCEGSSPSLDVNSLAVLSCLLSPLRCPKKIKLRREELAAVSWSMSVCELSPPSPKKVLHVSDVVFWVNLVEADSSVHGSFRSGFSIHRALFWQQDEKISDCRELQVSWMLGLTLSCPLWVSSKVESTASLWVSCLPSEKILRNSRFHVRMSWVHFELI